MTRRRKFAAALLALGVAGWAWNSSALAPRPHRPPRWLAHRGVHQTFPLDGVDDETCTAARIRPPTHAFLENTLPSMAAALAAGAEAVELDLHESADGALVVFHDHGLACRTGREGAPEDLPLAELRTLDVGWGYTADGGATWPLRGGPGVGAMPTLEGVLAQLPPDTTLVLHLKSADPEHGRDLGEVLVRLPEPRLDRIVVYGAAGPLEAVRAAVPEVRTFEPGRVKSCLVRYGLLGWTGHVPDACRGTWVLVPVSHAPWLWGWPRRFEARLAAVGSEVVLVGPWTGGRHVSGVDTAEDRAAVPADFGGWIWTNRIEDR